MINVELSNIWSCVSLPQLLGAEKDLFDAHLHLCNHQPIGNDYLGWLALPDAITAKTIHAVRSSADEIRAAGDTLVVIGAGGAYLGAKAGTALLGRQDRMQRGTRLLFTGDNFSAGSWLTLCDQLNGCDFSLLLISADGADMAPAVASRALRWMMERRYGPEAKTRIYVSALPDSPMAVMAKEEGYTLLSMPQQLGGAYSALTSAALVPLAVAGLDPLTVFEGAAEAYRAYDLRAFENPVWMYAGARHVLSSEARRSSELLGTFDPAFSAFGDWWQQSVWLHTCQQGAGLIPIHAELPAALGALDRAVASGQYPVFETLLRAPLPVGQKVNVEMDWKDYDGLGYLSGRTLADVEQASFEGMLQTHAAADVPVVVLETGPMDAAQLGELFYFFELANAISACAAGVDPFEPQNRQPSRAYTEQLLGKPDDAES